jgi:hypothetical protein
MTPLVVVVGLFLFLVVLARLVHVRVRVRTGVTFRDLRAFSREFDQRVSEYMNANYSGDPAQLESALGGLIPIAREIAARQPQPVPDDLLRAMIVTTLAVHHVAPRQRIESALDAVMGPVQRAA